MPSWFHGFKAVAASLGVFVTVAGGVVAILAALGIVGGEERRPEVDLIGRAEVRPGQEVDITGRNLDFLWNVVQEHRVPGGHRQAQPR